MGLQVNDIVQLRWEGTCFGQQIVMVHDYKVTDAADPGTTAANNLSDILNRVTVGGAQDITTPYLECLAPQYSLLKITAQRIWPARSAYKLINVLEPGGYATAATVANDSAALTMRTDLSGRSQVATKHIGPIGDGASSAGLLTNDMRILLIALGTALLTRIIAFGLTGGMDPVIVHRTDMTTTPLYDFVVGAQSRVQRRRTVGVGR